MIRQRRLAALGALVALLLTACGSSSPSTSTGSGAPAVKAASSPSAATPAKAAATATAASSSLDAHTPSLPDLGTAPNFTGTQDWWNTPGNRPLSLAGLRGRVVLVDFWTYTCINCIRTLPYLEAWDAKYRSQGLTIVGIEAPEFSFEKSASNVDSAIKQFGIKYPVVQDNNLATWNAWGNQYWPADYLIDDKGQVRYTAFGEGDYATTEAAIRSLLAAAGHKQAETEAGATPKGVVVPSMEATPETYLGTERGMGWVTAPVAGTHNYGSPPASLAENDFAFSGTWNIAGQPAQAISGAGIDVEFHAKNVYLVLSSAAGKPRTVKVLFDGSPAAPGNEGADVHNGSLTVTGQRLYSLVSLPTDSTHRLALRFPPGVTGFAFTFG
jgi:thiol-disulfide isomerase/thioredoxin